MEEIDPFALEPNEGLVVVEEKTSNAVETPAETRTDPSTTAIVGKLPPYNNTSYPLAVKEQLANIAQNYSEADAEKLKFHQFIIKEFFTRNKNVRGVLLKHDMGTGKTRAATSIAEFFRQSEPWRRMIVLLSKSLERNFKDTVVQYSAKDPDYVDANYRFISLNSNNMFKHVSNIDKTKEELDFENRLGNFMDDVKKSNSLDGSFLIIDEAHNLFNAITNGAKNAVALYDLIINSTNLKLIFMTGTPIINDPFELVPCFNMLRGFIDIDTGGSPSASHGGSPSAIHGGKPAGTFQNGRKAKSKSSSGKTLLFSEEYDEFEDFFIDRVTKSVKNKSKFMNRIYGLTSYYGDLYVANQSDKEGFPKKLPTVVEKVPMSQFQFANYIIARTSEREEGKQGFKGKTSRFSSTSGGSSSYRVKSRQLSNYCIPDYALGPVRGAKAREKFINKIKKEDLLNTAEFSPKFGKILSNIKTSWNKSPGIIYSQFVSGEGLGIMSRVLEAHGWSSYEGLNRSQTIGADDVIVDEIEEAYSVKSNNVQKIYAVLSGDIDPEERARLIARFNQPENADGSLIGLLLLSGAVAEGIDLKRIRHVHITEPFWNFARINQVETRAIRYLSHVDLPVDQQNVQVYIYLSDYPVGYPEKKKIEQTTDVELYQKSIDNMQIINQFVLALAESSIDCTIHHSRLDPQVKDKIHCKLCSPDGATMFYPLLNRDMVLPDSCKQYSESKVTAKEIIYEPTGEKFFYKKDTTGITIYQFNKKINGWMSMPRDYYNYGHIMEAILAVG